MSACQIRGIKQYRLTAAGNAEADLFRQDGRRVPRPPIEAVQWQGQQGPVTLEDIRKWGCRAELIGPFHSGSPDDLCIFVDGRNHPDNVAGENMWLTCYVGDWLLRLPRTGAFYRYSPQEFEERYELCAEE
jgi:hypothetical protein